MCSVADSSMSLSESKSDFVPCCSSPLPAGPQPALPPTPGSNNTENSDDSLRAESSGNVSTPTNPVVPANSFQRCPFRIGDKYLAKEVIGWGAFGYVVNAECVKTKQKVAIKQIRSPTSDQKAASRLLREMRFMRLLNGHRNLISLVDVLTQVSDEQMHVYLVMELMEADLEQIIKSKQVLSDDHIRYLTQQMMCGLRHLHQHGIVHRDLKPSNLVVDSFCRLKVCDLGLSRHIRDLQHHACEEDLLFTDYVVTRWYRAPELLVGSRRYTAKVDLWAAGCILGELLVRRPLFPGQDPSDMLIRIAAANGAPTASDIAALQSQPGVSVGASIFLHRLASVSGPSPAHSRLGELLPPRSNPDAACLLASLLAWDSRSRLGVEAALTHPFLAPLYQPPPPPPSPEMALAIEAACTGQDMDELAVDILREAALWSKSPLA